MKHFSLLDPFLSYKENGVLWMWSQEPKPKLYVKFQNGSSKVGSSHACKYKTKVEMSVSYKAKVLIIAVQCTTWGLIFSHVWPFYEWAVTDLDP